ncbi:MAG: BON domain-containing protein [Gemmatimonadota bacterium]
MKQSLLRAAAAAAVCVIASGCAPLIVGGVVAGGAMVATDRRSVGIQLEDEAIERRINRALAEKFPREVANINVSSYNRKVLLTGEVTTVQARSEAEQIAARSENVREVVNELQVGLLSTIAARTADTATTARVRAALVEAKEVPAATIRVVTDHDVVYLMGRVTETEGNYAGVVASRVSGVKQVVKLFDYLSPSELAETQNKPAPPAATEPPRK